MTAEQLSWSAHVEVEYEIKLFWLLSWRANVDHLSCLHYWSLLYACAGACWSLSLPNLPFWHLELYLKAFTSNRCWVIFIRRLGTDQSSYIVPVAQLEWQMRKIATRRTLSLGKASQSGQIANNHCCWSLFLETCHLQNCKLSLWQIVTGTVPCTEQEKNSLVYRCCVLLSPARGW